MAKASKVQHSIDWLLIRHASSTKHGNFEAVDSQLSNPFESGSATGGKGMPDEYCRPSDRWVSLCKFSKLNWVVVNTNQSLETLFDEFSQRRRLEIVWINWDAGVLQVKAKKSKEIQVELRSSDSKVEIEAKDKAFQKSLQACSNNPQRLSCVLEHFDIPSKIPGVIARNGEFEVIGKSGKRVKSGVKAFTIFNAYGSEAGTSDASELLDDALDICDLSKIKKAIQLGASLNRLPETSLTPLTKALYKIARYQNWEQCAQTLVDAGADVNGAGDREPPIIAVCSHLLEADQTVELLRFLIKNGAALNLLTPTKDQLSEFRLVREKLKRSNCWSKQVPMLKPDVLSSRKNRSWISPSEHTKKALKNEA